MPNSDRWLKPVAAPPANVSQSDVARIAREKREQAQQAQQTLLNSTSEETITQTEAPMNIAPAANIIPATKSAGATQSISPTDFTAPTKRTGQPQQIKPATESVAPAKSKGALLLSVDAPHLRTPHDITDKILPTLKPGCQVVLMRLYRLSAGFNSNTCHISIPKLASSCNISTTQTRIFLRDLEERKHIKRLSVDLSNKNQDERGITFEVLLPRLGVTKFVGAAENRPATKFVGAAESEPNKVNTQKENTQTQEPSTTGVRVGSKFTIEECRKYAQHLQATGQGINNPGGYATTIHRTGEADLLIKSFLNPIAPTQPLDISQCSDCQGSGFYYPNGINGGVTRCKHENLQGKPNSGL